MEGPQSHADKHRCHYHRCPSVGAVVRCTTGKKELAVAVVERRQLGGTCVNTGCVPTKTLVASAYVTHMARCAADYGVGVGPVTAT